MPSTTPNAESILGQSLELPFSKLTVPSRFVKAAMSEWLSTYDEADDLKRGKPSPTLIRLYEEWGKGGFGIILTGNIQVHRAHLETKGNAIIDPELPEDYTEEFRQLAKGAKAHGSLLYGQLSHAGRQVSVDIQSNPVSASDVQMPVLFGRVFNKPTPLTKEGIKDVINRFGHAAETLYRAGFDGVELHGAHGYLISQFLAPNINHRTDEYGGSLENRSRIIFEIIDEIRRRVNDPKFSVAMKLNTKDFVEGGFTGEDSRALCLKLEAAGMDWVEFSGGTYESMANGAGFNQELYDHFLAFATSIRPELSRMKLVVTGGMRDVETMTAAVSGSCDMVGIGRPSAAEPFLPLEIISGKKSRARDNLLDGFGFQSGAARKQMQDMGEGRTPTDFSVQENVDNLLKGRTPRK